MQRGILGSIKDLDKKLMPCIFQEDKDAEPLKWKFADPTGRMTAIT